LPDRDGLDPVGRDIYDYFADPDGTSYVGLWGPGGIRLHSPRVAEHTQSINRYIRRDAGIDPRLREIAVLITAREHDSQFEWSAHEPEALEQGVSPEIIDIIKQRKPLDGLDDTDALVIQLGREIFGAPRVERETFARAIDFFGKRGLVDFVTLMANYAGTAALLKTFDLQIKPDWEPLLPENEENT
jgi:4-carboxymuconolactone decarboxylase